MPLKLLTIAGTDPSGAAGIQADLQVFRDFHAHGLSVITAVVWQNTVGVRGFRAMQENEIKAQLAAIGDDIQIDGIKIGMLPTNGAIRAVVQFLKKYPAHERPPIVLDPIWINGNGEHLLSSDDAWKAMQDELYPLVDVITPNIVEAERIFEHPLAIDAHGQINFSRENLENLGLNAVLLKLGHYPGIVERGFVVDYWIDATGAQPLQALPTVPVDVRGTGCHLSSALLACYLRTQNWCLAAANARDYLGRLLHIRQQNIGQGRPLIVHLDEGDNITHRE